MGAADNCVGANEVDIAGGSGVDAAVPRSAASVDAGVNSLVGDSDCDSDDDGVADDRMWSMV